MGMPYRCGKNLNDGGGGEGGGVRSPADSSQEEKHHRAQRKQPPGKGKFSEIAMQGGETSWLIR